MVLWRMFKKLCQVNEKVFLKCFIPESKRKVWKLVFRDDQSNQNQKQPLEAFCEKR